MLVNGRPAGNWSTIQPAAAPGDRHGASSRLRLPQSPGEYEEAKSQETNGGPARIRTWDQGNMSSKKGECNCMSGPWKSLRISRKNKHLDKHKSRCTMGRRCNSGRLPWRSFFGAPAGFLRSFLRSCYRPRSHSKQLRQRARIKFRNNNLLPIRLRPALKLQFQRR